MPADFTLNDRAVVITGASRGIGEAIARAVANAGASVVLAARKQDGLDDVARSIRDDGGTALPVAAHVGKAEEVEALFDKATAEFGGVYGLVNNAATNVYFGPMLGIEEAAWDKIFEVNLKGPFNCTRAFATRSQGGGSIVNIASVAGLHAAPLESVYGMTKAALISMTRSLAAELGPGGIRVNAIAPGLVETRFAQMLIDDPDLRGHFVSRAPLARHAQPDEIAGAALYLLSDASSFTTGHTLVVDGGMTAT
jgi:NAD(P)-dependent dehydrogenase (short-subunit alcohol dehydrogenase family)